MAFPTDLTPQERLAISRKAIVRHMNRHHPEAQERLDDESGENIGTRKVSEYAGFSKLGYAARMWWHRHPASALADLASPFLADYARSHPFRLLGISAATGASLMLIRPWRMVSGSALLVAAVKSSGLSNTLLAMLSSWANPSENSDATP